MTQGRAGRGANSVTSGCDRQLWFQAPYQVEVRRAEIPRAAAGQIVVSGLASGISQGTELLLYRGEGPPSFDPVLEVRAAAGHTGESRISASGGSGRVGPFPCRYGYAWVGKIVDGSVPSGWDREQTVFALLPHGSHHVIGSEQLRAIDSGVPAQRAVLAANLETAITCVWDSGATVGDRAVVLGAGVVGLLVTWLLARAGCSVRVVEPAVQRCRVARLLGAELAMAPEHDEPAAEADLVVEATGDPSSLDRAIAHAATEARIVVVSFYGARRAGVDLGSDFHRRRLSLRSSQVSSIPPDRSSRWSRERRFSVVRRLLREEVLDQLLSRTAPIDEAPAIYEALNRTPGSDIQIVFTYGDG